MEGSHLQPPSLAYQLAFDLCAAMVARCDDGPAAVLASGPFYARELLKRLPRQATLHPLGDWAPHNEHLFAQLGPEVGRDGVLETSASMMAAPCKVAIWAEPHGHHAAQVQSYLTAVLGDGAWLFAVTSNRLRFLFPEHKGAAKAQAGLGYSRTVQFLGAWGFETARSFGLAGPASLVYGLLGRLATTLGREDAADRAFAGMRQMLIVEGKRAPWAPLSVISARRDA